MSPTEKKTRDNKRRGLGKVTWEDIAQLKIPQMAYITSLWKTKLKNLHLASRKPIGANRG